MKELSTFAGTSRDGNKFGQRIRQGINGLGVISTLVSPMILHTREAAAQNQAPTPRSELAAGFVDEKVPIPGLEKPTVIAFGPEWTMFIGEKAGKIKAVRVNSDIPILVADFSNEVNDSAEGFLGMDVDPKFNAGRPFVYTLYTRDAPPGENTPYWNDSCPDNVSRGCVVTGELDKLTINPTTMQAIRRTPIISGEWAAQYADHNIGTVAIKDNALFASAGDGASPYTVDYGQFNPYAMPRPIEGDPPYEGGSLRCQDPITPDDPTTLDGTIIRVNPDTGEPLPDNPNFKTGRDKNDKRIVAFGLRNPFRFTIKPKTDQLWIGDVGYKSYEEIDVTNPLESGNNLGWPCNEGAGIQPEFQALNLQMCNTLYNSNAAKPPYYAEGHNGLASSFTGIAFYDGDKYPQEYRGALFVANYSQDQIKAMIPGENGLPNPNNIRVFPAQNPVDLKLGPDGNLYYVDLDYEKPSESSIHRIRWAGQVNSPPYAKIDSDKNFGNLPLSVRFRSRSTDPDRDPLTCKWDLDGNGSYEREGCGEQGVVYGPDMNKNINATLVVTDSKGASNAASKTIFAGDTPPQPFITFPSAESIYDKGAQIDFRGFAMDAETSPEKINTSVTAQIKHCEDIFNQQTCHTHMLQEQKGLDGIVTMPDHGDPNKYYLELIGNATDPRGLANSRDLTDPGPSHAIIYPR